jgi:dipeptidyl aminopeptidase/acylaminoacyl peptidase
MLNTHRVFAAFLALLALTGIDLKIAPISAQNTTPGSLVYLDSARIGGKADYGIHVMNLATGKTRIFGAIPYAKGGVSVSDTGVIAQLQEQSKTDTVLIHLSQLDGTYITDFTWTEKNSFPVSGARISRDGTLVAFALQTILGNEKRGDRVVACETQNNSQIRCVYFDNLRDPAWMPDNRLVGINYEKQIYISDGPVNVADPASNTVKPVGPNTLDRARTAETTPDGRFVIFSSKAGIPRVYALELQTGLVKTLTSDGIGQYDPLISSDGKSLYFVQSCCQKTPTGGGGVFTSGQVHRIALNTTATTATPYGKNYLQNAEGKSVGPSGQYGLTTQTLR